MTQNNIIGWIYDKHGNQKDIHAPVNSNLEVVKRASNTLTGQIPDGVGNSTNKWGFKHEFGEVVRPTTIIGHYLGKRVFLYGYAVK